MQRVITLGDQAQRPRKINQMRDLALDWEMVNVDPESRVDYLRDVAQVERGRDAVQLHIGSAETVCQSSHPRPVDRPHGQPAPTGQFADLWYASRKTSSAATVTINSELRVQTEGSRRIQREVKIHNLRLVLAIGYRVTTPRAVQCRQWATTVLREYLVKGFALDDSRLKDSAGTDYFDVSVR